MPWIAPWAWDESIAARYDRLSADDPRLLWGAAHTRGAEPVTKEMFHKIAPIVVIDCSKQNVSLRSSPVDIRLVFEVGEDFSDSTRAYCLVIHDKSFMYGPTTGAVRRMD